VSEERKFALLFAASLLAARKLAELEAKLGSDKPSPARDYIIQDAISKAEAILRKIDGLYPPGRS
jgi:hypothetical protein